MEYYKSITVLNNTGQRIIGKTQNSVCVNKNPVKDCDGAILNVYLVNPEKQ